MAAEDRHTGILHSETGEKIRAVKAIEERNRRVEADKAWETSSLRRSIVAALTYIIIVLFLLAMHETQAYLKALIPVLGYILSTLALYPIKRWWQRNVYRPRT